MSEPTPAAFISYSREDSEFALRLAEDLKAAGASVWLDQLDIEPGRPWDSAIEEALISAPRMLLILSPASAKSNNVRNEISFALDEHKIIIPILHQDCDVPLQLRRIQRVDLRSDYARGITTLMKLLTVPHAQAVDAQRNAREDAQRLAQVEAERRAQEEAARNAREESERVAQGEAERRAQEEAAREAREESERKAREVAERKAQAEAERKARQEAERRSQEEVARKVQKNTELDGPTAVPQPEKHDRKSLLIYAGAAFTVILLILVFRLVSAIWSGPAPGPGTSPASSTTAVPANPSNANVANGQAAAPVAAPPNGPVRVPAKIMAAYLLSHPDPVYPEVARLASVQGVVVLHVLISKQGRISNVKVVSGPPILTTSAIEAVKGWRYKPYRIDGEPVEVDTTVNVNFSLPDDYIPAANGNPAANDKPAPPRKK